MKKFKILTGQEAKILTKDNNLLFIPITKEQGKEFIKASKLDAHFTYDRRTTTIDFDLPELKDKSLDERFKQEPLYMELIDMLIVYAYKTINNNIEEYYWKTRCEQIETIDIPDYQNGIIEQEEIIESQLKQIITLNQIIKGLEGAK